jgi:hypothetical protein
MPFCKDCDRPIRWVKNRESGKNLPVDVQPVMDENPRVVALFDDGAVLFPSAACAVEDTPLATVHFDTCPNRQRFDYSGRKIPSARR